jgi:hypothetical protein
LSPFPRIQLTEIKIIWVQGQGSSWECPGDSCGILDMCI